MKPSRLPWSWQGEDYRGGWGWQLLVDANGEGIACSMDSNGGPYRHLRAYMSIEKKYCKTGMLSNKDSARGFHIQQRDAEFILLAVNNFHSLLGALKGIVGFAEIMNQDFEADIKGGGTPNTKALKQWKAVTEAISRAENFEIKKL